MIIILSETQHVQLFMFKQLLNINQKKPTRFSLYPKSWTSVEGTRFAVIIRHHE
jgi:hypothetical protein